jgi:spermidine/putrescine transport system ATP-binding protein
MVISDRIAILREGVLEQIGPPEEVYERPASRFVASFLGECNLLTGAITEVRGEALSIQSPELGILWASAPYLATILASGQAVFVGVRPERLHIGEPGGNRVNAVLGRVRQAVYSGTVTRYVVGVGGTDIMAAALGAREHGVGDDIRMWWKLEDTIVIPDARAAGPSAVSVREA